MKINRLIAFILPVIAFIIMIVLLFDKYDPVQIGLLRGQEDFFVQTNRIAASTGKTVNIHYYDCFDEMKKDIASGSLDIYLAPLFEHIVDGRDHLAIAAVKADYILAGTNRKNPAPVGITEYNISKILIEHCKEFENRKYMTIRIKDKEKFSFFVEKIIDYSVFRNNIPEALVKQGVSPVISLSELGFGHDVLCVKKELLLKHDSLVEAIFLSSSLDAHMLPSEEEIKNAVRHLFKSGAITERKSYTEYVHIK